MPRPPELTVVLPVRDVAGYLPDMLTALRRNADAVDLQVVAVDDGSTDATPDVLAEYAPVLPLEIVRHERAVGLASARNVGLAAARGRYVTFLDGDDWIAPGYLAALVAAMDGLGCDFVRVDHVQVRGRERELHRAPEAHRGVVLDPREATTHPDRRTMADYPFAWAGIYRRDLGDLLRFDDGLHTAEDRPWIFRLHRGARTFAVVSLAGVFYRREVAGSLTRIGDARQLHFLDAFAILLRDAAQAAVTAGDAGPAVQAKATRQFLTILALHLADTERLDASLRAELRRRASAMVAALPPATLTEAVRRDRRLEAVRPLLPPAPAGSVGAVS